MTYSFDEHVTTHHRLEFHRWDGRVIRVYPFTRGVVVTPVQYAPYEQRGLMLVHWDGVGYWWTDPNDVVRCVKGDGQ